MIGTELAEVVADSTEDNEETQNYGASSASANCESVEEYEEERMWSIKFQWYCVYFKYKFNFPESFNAVPVLQTANRIWTQPMDYEEVA